MDVDSDNSSLASSELDEESRFNRTLRRIRNNDPLFKRLDGWGGYDIFEEMTYAEWEDLGRDISNNTYLERLEFYDGLLDDDKLISLFRGLTGSSSIVKLNLSNNEFSFVGFSLEPFLQNSINLRELDVSSNNIQNEGLNDLWQVLRDSPIERLYCSYCGITSIDIETVSNIQYVSNNLQSLRLSGNNIQSEGFNRLLWSLRDSSVEVLGCYHCGIESIEIVNDSLPRKLKTLNLASNRIKSNGCRGIAKLLQEGGTTLEKLSLDKNLIDDEGVTILVDALKTNTSLTRLDMKDNSGITRNGRILILKMLNDISSINATLQSNHTLQIIRLGEMDDDIYYCTNMATAYNGDSVAAGREKVIQTQLHSKRRAKLAGIQGVQHSLYSEINPLHLPEVLSLVGCRHGQDELYVALKASIAEVMTTVDRKQCIQQYISYHASMVAEHEKAIAQHSARHKELNEQLATMGEDSSALAEQRSTKRRRK